jgi:hypothetical protein
MLSTEAGEFVFELPLWLVGSRRDGQFVVATGRVGEKDCLLVFTTPSTARQCIQGNAVRGARLQRLGTPKELLDFLQERLPAGVTHVAFDVGQVGDASPAIVSWEELAAKVEVLAGLGRTG